MASSPDTLDLKSLSPAVLNEYVALVSSAHEGVALSAARLLAAVGSLAQHVVGRLVELSLSDDDRIAASACHVLAGSGRLPERVAAHMMTLHRSRDDQAAVIAATVIVELLGTVGRVHCENRRGSRQRRLVDGILCMRVAGEGWPLVSPGGRSAHRICGGS